MKPNTIDENISSLLEAFKESPEYVEFQKQNEILKQKPELKKEWMLSEEITTEFRMNVAQIICSML